MNSIQHIANLSQKNASKIKAVMPKIQELSQATDMLTVKLNVKKS